MTIAAAGWARRIGSSRVQQCFYLPAQAIIPCTKFGDLRLALAAIVLLVALRMLYGLGVQPDEIYTVAPL